MLHQWYMESGLKRKKKHIVLCNMEKMVSQFCTSTLVIFVTCVVDVHAYQNHIAIAAHAWTEVQTMGDILGYAFIVAAIIFFVYGIWVERKYDQIADRLNEMMEEKNDEV